MSGCVVDPGGYETTSTVPGPPPSRDGRNSSEKPTSSRTMVEAAVRWTRIVQSGLEVEACQGAKRQERRTGGRRVTDRSHRPVRGHAGEECEARALSRDVRDLAQRSCELVSPRAGQQKPLRVQETSFGRRS